MSIQKPHRYWDDDQLYWMYWPPGLVPVDTQPQTLFIPEQDVPTRDKALLQVEAEVEYRVADPATRRRLADLQYWIMLFGVIGFFLVLTAAGLVQGHAWLNGEMVYRVLPELVVYLVLRGAIGVAVVLAACLQLYNVVMTIRKGELIGNQPAHAHAREASPTPAADGAEAEVAS